MIRVAFMAHDGAGDMGGVATWMADLVPWLRAAGVDARVIGYRRPGATPLFDHFGRSGVPLDIRSHFDPFPDRVAWLAEVVRTRAIDVLVPNYFLSGFVAAHRMGRERSRVVAIRRSKRANQTNGSPFTGARVTRPNAAPASYATKPTA